MADPSSSVLTLLEHWLSRRLDDVALSWFRAKKDALAEDRDFYLTFALAPRRLGKADLSLTADEREAAQELCPSWSPRGWTIDQTARIALLLSGPEPRFLARLEKLCATGDIGEQVTLYQALPIYPNPEALAKRAAEGLRTNIVPVFQAVAHHNPFPQAHFDEAAWNQMVLKALFVGTSLHPILGLDERANEPLAMTLVDYAHERWAAHRSVNPELWRCVGPFIDTTTLKDVQRAWDSENTMEREAAALSLSSSTLPESQKLLRSDASLFEAITQEELTWASVHETLFTP